MSDTGGEEIDWSLTTWEGAKREQLRRWAALPLESIVAALEEMQEIANGLHPDPTQIEGQRDSGNPRSAGKIA
jgi:hypothetical protein